MNVQQLDFEFEMAAQKIIALCEDGESDPLLKERIKKEIHDCMVQVLARFKATR